MTAAAEPRCWGCGCKLEPDDPQPAFCVRCWIAPGWTDEQIAALQAHQDNPALHPYTCGTDSRHRPLVPTRAGWHCLDCDYTQNWAHAVPSAT